MIEYTTNPPIESTVGNTPIFSTGGNPPACQEIKWQTKLAGHRTNMKEELIKKLIEEKGKRAFYIRKYDNNLFRVFWDKWSPLIAESSAKIKEIYEQLSKII